jgi:hypothetical protein
MTSEPFSRFRFSFFGDADSARQGLDVAALAQLADGERAEAQEMLIHGLPDARCVIGLGVLRAGRAAPALSALFEVEQQMLQASQCGSKDDWQPYALVHLAKTLWQISPDRRWSDSVMTVLASAPDALHRQSAVEALGDMNEPAVTRALITALDDPDALVRYHAGKRLLARHGLATDTGDTHSMLPRVMSQDVARRESGKQEILAAIAG